MTKEVEDAKKEMEVYDEYLNRAIGVGGMVLGLACLGTPHPSFFCGVSLLIVFPFTRSAKMFFPKTVLAARELVKEFPDNEEIKTLLSDLDRNLFSFSRFFDRNWTYLAGVLFVSFVLFSELLLDKLFVQRLLNN